MFRVRLFALSIIMLVAVIAGAQPDWQNMSPEEQQKMMQEWQRLSTPAEAHQRLDAFVGTWKTTTTMWMGGPGSPPMSSPGTSTKEWIMGGRWLREDFEGMFMGQPMTGLGLTGYDNFKNMYINTWCDNVSTTMTQTTGMWHPETGVFTFYGLMDEPMLDVQDRTVKYSVTVENEDKHVFSMYDLHAGDDYKVFEIVYERVK